MNRPLNALYIRRFPMHQLTGLSSLIESPLPDSSLRVQSVEFSRRLNRFLFHQIDVDRRRPYKAHHHVLQSDQPQCDEHDTICLLAMRLFGIGIWKTLQRIDVQVCVSTNGHNGEEMLGQITDDVVIYSPREPITRV